MLHDLINLVILLVCIGFVAWLVQTFIPIAEPFKRVGTALIGLLIVLMVLGVLFGHWHPPSIFDWKI